MTRTNNATNEVKKITIVASGNTIIIIDPDMDGGLAVDKHSEGFIDNCAHLLTHSFNSKSNYDKSYRLTVMYGYGDLENPNDKTPLLEAVSYTIDDWNFKHFHNEDPGEMEKEAFDVVNLLLRIHSL